jgi:hypothetical protein
VSTKNLSKSIVDTYLGAVDWLIAVLGSDEVSTAWPEPSVIASYTVGGVVAHAVQGVLWLEQLLRDREPAGLRPVTLAEFFGPNRADESHESADRDPLASSLVSAAEEFARAGPTVVVSACTTSRDGLTTLLRDMRADRAVPVLRVSGGQIPLFVYLRTRVLEAVVHGDDVASSVVGLRVPDPPVTSLQVCLDVCIELAQARIGGLGVLRAFTRVERALPDALRVL